MKNGKRHQLLTGRKHTSRRRRMEQTSGGLAMMLLGTLIVLGLVCFLVAGIAPAPAHASGNVSAVPSEQSTEHTAAPLTYVVGIPAIMPHLGTAQTSEPAFTATDASAYAAHHYVPRAQGQQSFPTVVSVAFITDAALKTLLHGEDAGEAPSALLCYVVVRGTFMFPGPGNASATYHKAIEVFDGHTGNLLMFGGQL